MGIKVGDFVLCVDKEYAKLNHLKGLLKVIKVTNQFVYFKELKGGSYLYRFKVITNKLAKKYYEE
jgi:hypothetical protein